MTLKITKKAYMKLIQEDLDFLNKHLGHLEGSIELDHVKLIICSSIDWYFPDNSKEDQP